jgi:chitinase domain-containing protein 1
MCRQQQQALFDQYDFATLANEVDLFSLMTYDFASADQIGPNAPAMWIRQCVEMLLPNTSEASLRMRKRILIGMNFYGYDFVPGNMSPIRGGEYVAILKEHRPAVQWFAEAAEHFITYQTGIGTHFVYYPTLYSIEVRLQLTKGLEVGGIAIWELGQGLNYFFDLL